MQSRGSYRLAEGPIYDERMRVLYFVDILAGKLVELFDNGCERVYSFDDFTTSVHLTTDEKRVLVTGRNTVFLFNVNTEEKELVQTLPFSSRMRFNDGAVAPDGSLFMGTMKINEPRSNEGRLYRITGEGWSELPGRFGIPNGLVFLDEKTMIHIDSQANAVRKMNTSGEVLFEKIFEEDVCPDGMTVTSDGMLLIALWNTGEIAVLDSTTLTEAERIGGFRTSLSSVALSDDGRLFATSGEDEIGAGVLYVLETEKKKKGDNLWLAGQH